MVGPYHKRRIEREEKAKLVASVWREKFIQFLAALAVLPQLNWKKKLNSSLSFKSTEGKQPAGQGNDAPKQTDATTFAFASVSILLLWSIYIIRLWFL